METHTQDKGSSAGSAPLQNFYGSSLGNEMTNLNMKLLQKDGCSFRSLPIGLTPVPVPKENLDELESMQINVIDRVMYEISRSFLITSTVLNAVAEKDDFIGNLLQIHKKAVESGIYDEKAYVSVIRSDYFLCSDSDVDGEREDQKKKKQWKLIEMNTVSVAGGFFVDQIDQLYTKGNLHDKLNVHVSNRTEKIVDGLEIVHNLSSKETTPRGSPEHPLIYYNNCHSMCKGTDPPKCDKSLNGDNRRVFSEEALDVVLILVRNYKETFKMDQLAVAHLLNKRKISVLISTLEDIVQYSYEIDPRSKTLVLNKAIVNIDQSELTSTSCSTQSFRVSCVYFRGGYDPADYVNKACWNFLEEIELSRTVLVPSVGLHLAGTKKIQSALSSSLSSAASNGDEQEVATNSNSNNIASNINFITNLIPTLSSSKTDQQPIVDLFHSTFVSQFEVNALNREQVLSNVNKYVLKPQREGGTHNLFGEEIDLFLRDPQNKDLMSHYIAMELIKGEVLPMYPVRRGDGSIGVIDEAVAEIGCCSVVVIDHRSNPPHCSNTSSHCASTKLSSELYHKIGGIVTKIKNKHSNEAGVSVGHGFLTSISSSSLSSSH